MVQPGGISRATVPPFKIPNDDAVNVTVAWISCWQPGELVGAITAVPWPSPEFPEISAPLKKLNVLETTEETFPARSVAWAVTV